MRFIFFLSLVTVALFGCTRTEEEEATLKQFQDETPLKEAFQVRFVFSENAIVQAELDAPHAIESKENNQEVRIFDRGLHLIFYTPEGLKQSDLTARNGKFKNQFNDAEVWGDVVMVNSKGDRLMADTLFWNKTKNRLKAKPALQVVERDTVIVETVPMHPVPVHGMMNLVRSMFIHPMLVNTTLVNTVLRDTVIKEMVQSRPVVIKTATEDIYGDSLDANTDFTEYKIFNIKGGVNVKEGEL